MKKYVPSRLGRQPLTVRPRSTSTTTRRPSILRPSARLYAAESEVLTVNTTKSHRRLDHGFLFLTRNRLTLIAYLIETLIFTSEFFQGGNREREKETEGK